MKERIRNWAHQINKKKAPYVFIAPFFILFAIFKAYPLAYTFYLSFHRWAGYGPWKFVGLENYLSLFTNKAFVESLKNVLFFMTFLMPLLIVLSLAMAFVLSFSSMRLRGFFRVVYIIPYVMIPTVTAMIFKILLQSKFGIVNYYLQTINIPPVPWVESASWVKPALTVILTWQWVGFYMIIMLGGLQAIDLSLYEAARIDGANSVQIFFRITIPLLMPVILFCLIIATLWIVLLFDIPYYLTRGGPAYSSYTPGFFLYVTAFHEFRLGAGSSAAITICLLLGTISFLWVRLLPKYE